MKLTLFSLLLFALFFMGCDDEIIPAGKSLSMKVNNRVVLTADDIDYYDLSTHFIYLKGTNSFINDKLVRDSFQVYVDNKKIYSGVFHSWYMSSLPLGPAIYAPVFYNDYIIPVSFGAYFDADGKRTPPVDPRNDPRILQTLKSNGQLHEGLKCEIKSVQITPGSSHVSLELVLANNDSFNYYYLDPDKMGMGLFHYFTNGLSFWSSGLQKSFSNNVKYIQPNPYDAWEISWLSVIRSRETKTIRINYTNFDPLSKGWYRLQFSFPGLNSVDRKELIQGSGRIWLGELDLSQDFQIK